MRLGVCRRIRSDFTYDLSRFTDELMKGDVITPFAKGLENHLRWLITKPDGAPLIVEIKD